MVHRHPSKFIPDSHQRSWKRKKAQIKDSAIEGVDDEADEIDVEGDLISSGLEEDELPDTV